MAHRRRLYQVLLGGFHTRFRTDYEWPAYIDTDAENAACGGYWDGVKRTPCLNVPFPEYDETRRNWLLFQPGWGWTCGSGAGSSSAR